MVLDNVHEARHLDNRNLQQVSLLPGPELGVGLTERAGAGPELGAANLLTGQRPEVVLGPPETAADEPEVRREHLDFVLLQLGDDTSEPVLSGLEDQELANAEIINGYSNFLSLLSQILEFNLNGKY